MDQISAEAMAIIGSMSKHSVPVDSVFFVWLVPGYFEARIMKDHDCFSLLILFPFVSNIVVIAADDKAPRVECVVCMDRIRTVLSRDSVFKTWAKQKQHYADTGYPMLPLRDFIHKPERLVLDTDVSTPTISTAHLIHETVHRQALFSSGFIRLVCMLRLARSHIPEDKWPHTLFMLEKEDPISTLSTLFGRCVRDNLNEYARTKEHKYEQHAVWFLVDLLCLCMAAVYSDPNASDHMFSSIPKHTRHLMLFTLTIMIGKLNTHRDPLDNHADSAACFELGSSVPPLTRRVRDHHENHVSVCVRSTHNPTSSWFDARRADIDRSKTQKLTVFLNAMIPPPLPSVPSTQSRAELDKRIQMCCEGKPTRVTQPDAAIRGAWKVATVGSYTTLAPADVIRDTSASFVCYMGYHGCPELFPPLGPDGSFVVFRHQHALLLLADLVSCPKTARVFDGWLTDIVSADLQLHRSRERMIERSFSNTRETPKSNKISEWTAKFYEDLLDHAEELLRRVIAESPGTLGAKDKKHSVTQQFIQHGSLYIYTAGSRVMRWRRYSRKDEKKDFLSGTNLVSLVKHIFNDGGTPAFTNDDAYRWCRSFLASVQASPSVPSVPLQPSAPSTNVNELSRTSVPLEACSEVYAHTKAVKRYLCETRCLSTWTQIRSLVSSDIQIGHPQSSGKIASLLCWCHDKHGVQLIVINTETGAAPVGPDVVRKRSIGTMSHCIVHRAPVPSSPTILCEGPEDGLTLMLALPEMHVCVTFGIGHIASFQSTIPECHRIIICADNDDNPALADAPDRSAATLIDRAYAVAIVRPPLGHKDVNAMLMNKRDRWTIERLRTCILSQLPPNFL